MVGGLRYAMHCEWLQGPTPAVRTAKKAAAGVLHRWNAKCGWPTAMTASWCSFCLPFARARCCGLRSLMQRSNAQHDFFVRAGLLCNRKCQPAIAIWVWMNLSILPTWVKLTDSLIDWGTHLLLETVIQYPCLRVYAAQIHVDLSSRFFWGFDGIELTTSGLTVPLSDQLS